VVVTDAGPKVAFRRAGEVLLVDPVQLDEVETAFAMTIHKSQGSEYPTVLMILPPEGSLLVGRELVYTGITRAREKLILVGSPAVVEEAVSTSSHRMTGLRDRID
jgi:exodeoxyribonuclease V alpha subunit